MTKQTEAQRLADLLGYCVPRDSASGEAAALLRRQDELLRQALEALDRLYEPGELARVNAAITAIHNHLEAK